MYLVSLTFDDGIRDSCLRAAEIFERFGLAAGFNVIAEGHRMAPPDAYHRDPRGDFALWNELQARGHEIMPHGLRHRNKAEMSFDQARASIEACLEVFAAELEGFEARRAVFAFPYNASTPALEAWLPSRVRAFRAGGGGLNPLPHAGLARLRGALSGADDCEADLAQEIAELFARPAGWLVYCAHGLDGQGWGPLPAATLERWLERLLARGVELLPPGRALEKYGSWPPKGSLQPPGGDP